MQGVVADHRGIRDSLAQTVVTFGYINQKGKENDVVIV